MTKKDTIACSHEGCERTMQFGGCSRGLLKSMFGGDKLVASAFAAIQAGWQLDMQPDGDGFMFCPDHKS